jgi:phage shock protein C
MTTYKQLFRSKKNKVFGGVCGGIGEFINIDPVIIRLIWLVLFFMFGVGLLVYLFSWLIIPSEPIKEESIKEESIKEEQEEKTV